MTDISTSPPATTHQARKGSPSSQCPTCKRFFKGKRGLNIHLRRSPDCKRNPPSIVPVAVEEELSLPQKILNAVKCPSTSIESLESMCGDGLNTKIHKHNSKHGCGLCDHLSTKDHFVSSSTHRVYEATIPPNIPPLDCNATNVIYLITCRKCRLQYVGETAQLLRDHLRHHKSGMKHPEKDNTCRILSEHFSKGFCKNATFTVNIIDKLAGDGRDESKEIDPAITAIRRKRETEWMLRLRTVFPHGLNDRIGDEYMTERDSSNIFSKFPPLKRIKERQRIRSKNFSSSDFICQNFIYIMYESLRVNLRNSMNLIRVLLSSLKKSLCRILFDKITEHLSEKHDSFSYFQYFQAALDILTSKLGSPPVHSSSIKKAPKNRCHVKFHNKAIDFINIQRILRNQDVKDMLPSELKEDTPMVVYELVDTIHSKLFNYKKFVQSIDVDSFLADNSIFPCECKDSPFINVDHKHIITGNLDIVTNSKLRDLISKGPKYREPVQFSCDIAKVEILKGIDNCVSTWSKREKIPLSVFQDWRNMIADRIDDRILALTPKKKRFVKSAFKVNDVKECLTDLQSKYIMVPIDKAANNVAFICKRYYALVLLQELGLSGVSTSTYTQINHQSPDDIIFKHQKELQEKFNITVEDEMLTLPDIYWTPKLHKSPVKFRFIIASKKCTIKKLSQNLSSIFSLIDKQIAAYNKKSRYYSGINSYWIVQNRDPVMDTVKKSVDHKSAKCVSSFDFSTLYTKIPHDKLLDVLGRIIDFVFKGGTRKKIAVNRNGIAFWVDDRKVSCPKFTKDSIGKSVEYLVTNCFFRFGNKLFRQDIGIPMGSDPAPYFANLFLYHYESTWLKTVKKNDNILARKFGNVFRYIDDLLALNDGKSFESFRKEIYPPELQLNKENIIDTETNFLDLHIKINNKTFTTMLYDKRDHFGFDITRLPYRSSNMPSRMFYSSISAECLRVCRATSSCVQAKLSIQSLLSRMLNQGATVSNMKNSISRTFCRHHIGQKFGTTDGIFVNQLFV